MSLSSSRAMGSRLPIKNYGPSVTPNEEVHDKVYCHLPEMFAIAPDWQTRHDDSHFCVFSPFLLMHITQFPMHCFNLRVYSVLIALQFGAVQRDNIVPCPQLKLWLPYCPQNANPRTTPNRHETCRQCENGCSIMLLNVRPRPSKIRISEPKMPCSNIEQRHLTNAAKPGEDIIIIIFICSDIVQCTVLLVAGQS